MSRTLRSGVAVLTALAGGLGFAAATASAGTIRIGVYSQRQAADRADAGARITVDSARPAQPVNARRRPISLGTGSAAAPTDVAVSVSYPSLPASSQLYKNPAPFGPGTFWYQGGTGLACIYSAGSSPLCYRITGATSPAAPGIDPARLAASVAAHFDLVPGRISASPASAGLTGAASWFWLDPAPTSHEATITLAGETLTVVATPTVEWDFGDGSRLTDAGPGRPYAPGPAPPAAVTHVYETRCLPGDRGRDPNVLSQCTNGGYSVVAAVVWHFSYRASGPVSGSGTVPARTTDTSTDYPVSEARAFLIGGGP